MTRTTDILYIPTKPYIYPQYAYHSNASGLHVYRFSDTHDHKYNIIENILVWSLIIGTLLSYVPQYYKIYQNKSPKGLSESTIVCGIYSCVYNVLGTIQQDYVDLTHCNDNHNCYSSIIPIIQLVAPLLCILILYIYYLLYAHRLYDFEENIENYNYIINNNKILEIYSRSRYHGAAVCLLILIVIMINRFGSVNTIVTSGKVLNIISAIFSVVMWLPQLYMTYRLKNAHSLSLIALTIHSLGCFATVIYQGVLMHQNWLVVVNYIIGGISEALIVFMSLYYKRLDYQSTHYSLDMNLIYKK